MKRLMVFIEGTAFNTKLAAIKFNPRNYTPIGNAVEKLNIWSNNYTIVLCTFRRHNIGLVRDALAYYGVKYDTLEYRRKGESYADMTVRIMPDILVEDDCASIGGDKEMCIAAVPESVKQRIKSVVVKEFDGIDVLSDLFE